MKNLKQLITLGHISDDKRIQVHHEIYYKTIIMLVHDQNFFFVALVKQFSNTEADQFLHLHPEG